MVYTFGTPTGPAVKGALAHARAHQVANPGHRVALVLATDGPGGLCEQRDAAAISALVAAEAKGAPPILTYVIGAFSAEGLASDVPFVESVAAAGGTGKAFVLNTDPDLAGNFLDALKKIRDASLPCEFVIPRPNGPIDFGKVNVRLQDAAGAVDGHPLRRRRRSVRSDARWLVLRRRPGQGRADPRLDLSRLLRPAPDRARAGA